MTVDAYEEGNSFNQVIYLSLIILAVIIVVRRRIDWGDIVQRNRAILLFLGYAVLSGIWADYPFVSLKGSFKAVFGNFVMALLILTDRNPTEAVRTILRRSTFVLVPLSVLVIKYFPAIGRQTHRWTYETGYLGIAVGANGLATLCYICGVFVIASVVRRGALAHSKEFTINLVMLAMILWLMVKADGATSNACLLLGTIVLLCLKTEKTRRHVVGMTRHVGVLLCVLTPIIVLNYGWFMDAVAVVFGHSETLWGRLGVWREVVALVDSPWFGAGYNSFWLGERLAKMWAIYSWRPTQAHNGYVETYLNLGFIGILLLAVLVISTFRRAASETLRRDVQNLKLPYMAPILFYNLTEAAFRGLHLTWFVFLVVSLETEAQVSQAGTEEGRRVGVLPRPVRRVPSRLLVAPSR